MAGRWVAALAALFAVYLGAGRAGGGEEAAQQPFRFTRPDGISFAVGPGGVSEIRRGDQVIASGGWSARNASALFGLGEAAVRLAPITGARVEKLGAQRVRVVHETPDALLEYDYVFDGPDMRMHCRITNRHATAPLAAVGFQGLLFQWEGALRGRLEGWGDGYLRANAKYIFPQGDGRIRGGLSVGCDDRVGISLSPLRLGDGPQPAAYVNWNDGGRRPEVFVACAVPPGQTRDVACVLRLTADGEPRWTELVAPYRDYLGDEAAARIGYALPRVEAGFYPSYPLLRLRVNLGWLAANMPQVIRSGKVSVAGPAGEPVAAADLALGSVFSLHDLPLPRLDPGEYTVEVTLDGYGPALKRTFTRTYFPWEGNKLGVTDKVLPPFEPVQVEGNTVKVVGRTYRVVGCGLWDSAVSLGRELLAGPMAIRVNEGRPLGGTGRFTAAGPQAAVYEGRAEDGAVTVSTRCTTEYDGCMKVELTLGPGTRKEPLEALWIEIPIAGAEAPLYHVTGAGLRSNPVGALPPGDGVVWDSRKPINEQRFWQRGLWFTNFKPYIWVGGEERGLCWFADNDKGWVLDYVESPKWQASPACQSLTRAGGVLTLRVNLVQKPVRLGEPRRIVFGLMASPVKPMPEDWRRTTFCHAWKDFPDISGMLSEYWGSDEHFSAKYPRNGDFSILDAMYEIRRGGKLDRAKFAADYEARNFQPGQPMGSKPKEQIMQLVRLCLEWMGHGNWRRAQSRAVVYWEEFVATSRVHPDARVFIDEWAGTFGRWGQTSAIVPSYRDFACWYGAQFVKRGFGLYFDNAFPERDYDTLTTDAYHLADGDPRVQPTAGIWARREYLRRIWVIHRELAPADYRPAMMLHMTNTLILPYMGWADATLDLEWRYGPQPAQQKFSPELLRAESIGRQVGCVPCALARIENAKTQEERDLADRTRFGVLMVHEIRIDPNGGQGSQLAMGLFDRVLDFGYGADDCEVFNYWDDGYPVKTTNDRQVKSLLLKRGTELMLVICTWNPEPEEVTFTLDTGRLGLKPAAAVPVEPAGKGAAAAAAPEPVPVDAAAGRFAVKLPGYGVLVLRLK